MVKYTIIDNDGYNNYSGGYEMTDNTIFKWGIFEVTMKELMIAISFVVMGFIFSSRQFILYLNDLNPMQGLVAYYAILYGSVFILSLLGLTVFGFKIKKPLQHLGLLLIIFSFFITINWESPYVDYVTKGHYVDVSPIHYQAEDGATYYFWEKVMHIEDINKLRIMTFMITPFVLSLIGAMFVSEKIKIL